MIKKYNIQIALFSFTLFITATSCSKYVEDMNTDPNKFSNSTPEVMFQGAILANQFWQNASGARLAMIWMNQATGADRQYVALNNWNSAAAPDFNDPWKHNYGKTIGQAQLIKSKALAISNFKLAGAAQVIEAYSLGMATALWGDIPYTEANNFDKYPNPKFDPQKNVYEATLKLLDDAIKNLKNIGAVPATKDIYYKGDASKWIALAHALKARYYLHLGEYDKANNEAKLGITAPSGDMIAQYGNTNGLNLNPFYSFQIFDREGYMTAGNAYAPSLLKTGTPVSRENSKTDESARFNYNYIGEKSEDFNINTNLNGKFRKNIPLITYGEMLLIQAECETRLNGLSEGLKAYNTYRSVINSGYSIGNDVDGVIKYEPYTEADFEANKNSIENPDNILPKDALVREILEERYVYFIGHFEAFNDFRRTNNGAEITLKSGFSNVPERFIYAQSEINSNNNVPNPLPKVTEPTPINN